MINWPAPPVAGRYRTALRDRLESGGFTVTAEIGLPRGARPDAVSRKLESLRGLVDAVNMTDNPSAHVRLASWAGSVLALAAGVEPVMQLTGRDRNRIALQSDLLSASALGIPNVLLMTGDHPRFGDDPEAKPVFDLDGIHLLRTARTMRDEGRLLSGRTLDPPPNWLIGAAENPFDPVRGLRAARLGAKVAAGAQFVQTQFVFDVASFARWMADVRDLGLDKRCWVLAGVGPIRSLRALDHMTNNVPGLHVPGEVSRRLRGVPADRVAAEGMAICAEIIEQVREIPGVSGIHVMAPGSDRAIPEILGLAGIPARDFPLTASAGPDESAQATRIRGESTEPDGNAPASRIRGKSAEPYGNSRATRARRESAEPDGNARPAGTRGTSTRPDGNARAAGTHGESTRPDRSAQATGTRGKNTERGASTRPAGTQAAGARGESGGPDGSGQAAPAHGGRGGRAY